MQTLSKRCCNIINNLGATTMEDLKLVDHGMASNATQDLKLIPRKKAMIALMAISAEKNKHEFSTKKMMIMVIQPKQHLIPKYE